VFVILGFTLLTYQGITRSHETSLFDFFLYPLRILEHGSSSIARGVKNLFKNYILIVGKEEEVRRLNARVKELEQERNKLIEALSENKRLKALLELKSKRTEYVTTAEVFARDPTNWFQILWINKGEEDGIEKDMTVMGVSGLVGRTHKVLKDTANIILITDVNSSVAVRLQSIRHEGILEGRGGNRCYLKYIPEEEDVRIGEMVFTSGLDGIYPPELPVGYVSKVIKKGGGLFQYIEVTPLENLNKVEEVAILKR